MPSVYICDLLECLSLSYYLTTANAKLDLNFEPLLAFRSRRILVVNIPNKVVGFFELQRNPSKADTIGTTTVCLKYGGICTSGGSGVLPLGMVMNT